MKFKGKSYLITCIFLLSITFTLNGQFQKLETENLTLIYFGKPHEFIVSHLASCFENSLKFHRNLFQYTPSEKITVLLQDFGDYLNGGATSIPRNFVMMGLSPANYVFETLPANERMNWTMNHELVHIVTTDQASGREIFFRSIFRGKVWPSAQNPVSVLYSYLTSPRDLAPRWFHEGVAVFMETWMAGGLGRALGNYDEMVFRSMVRDESYIYDIIGLESEGTAIDFQVGVNSYLYGTRFISYLAYKHSPAKVLEWAGRKKGSKSYFSSQFKKVYNVSLDEEWSRWIEWEHRFQQANLDSIRLNPTTNFHQISQKTLGSISRAFYDSTTRNIYAALLYPGQVAHIAAINVDTGIIDKICEVKGAALYFVSSLAYDPTENLIYYSSDNNLQRDLNVVDIKTGKSKRLMKDNRIGDLVFNQTDRSLWGVRHDGGYSTLVRIPYPHEEWNQIYTFEYGHDIFDLDISPDGLTITSALVEPSGFHNQLIKLDVTNLLKGETGYEVLFDFDDNIPESFIFSPDGSYLYGSTYYTGVSNIWRYDFRRNDMSILSNCESGFFRPVTFTDDSLIVMRYTGSGFVPVMIANQPLKNVSSIKFLGNKIVEKHPIVEDWVLDPPSSINIDSLTTYTGSYNTYANIGLTSIYPILGGYKDFAAFGMHLKFSDLLGLTGFDITTSYSPNQDLPSQERLHFEANFFHWSWKLHGAYNNANFYDLFGPTKTSRKGYFLGLQYKKTLIYDDPKVLDLNFSFSGYGGLERLPDFQNVVATFDKLLSSRLSLDYKHVRTSLGAVDGEKGIKMQLVSQGNYVNSELFPRINANLDYGIPLPMAHSSIWIRSFAGYSFGDKNNPFANFFFGGFGNNWIDYLAEKRYREYYSFPGVELNQFGGKNYGKMVLEWNLPPIRFRRVGFTSFYFRWARVALFSSTIRTNFDGIKAKKPPQQFGAKRTLHNIGGQIDFRIVLFSRFNSTLTFGYAAAFEEGQKVSKEFMFSLKIL